MGSVESSAIQINFNRPNLLYYAGEQVAGTIVYQNNKDKIDLGSIFLEFIGEVGYTTREFRQIKDNNGHERKEEYTKYHSIPFTNIRIPIVQPQYGQSEVILYSGQHSWPFQFFVPQYIPPSTVPSTTAYPYVKYYTRIVIDKPWYKPNEKHTYSLTIFPRVNISHVPNAQYPTSFSNENRKRTRLQCQLIRSAVVPGEKVFIHIDIQNPKQVVLKGITATLVQHQQIAQNHRTESIYRMDLPEVREFNDLQLQRTFELPIPSLPLSPTYTYLLQNITHPTNINIYYELLLELKAHGLFTDFKVTAPIFVGTESIPPQTQEHQQAYNQFTAPTGNYDTSPPSYNSVFPYLKKE